MRSFVCFAVMLASAPAFAFTYPGGMCQHVSGGNWDVDSNGHLENEGSSTLFVVCPLVVDDPLSVGGILANIYVTDYTSVGQVCCSSRAKSTGSSYTTGNNSCSGLGDLTVQGTGSLTLAALMPSAPSTNSSRYLYCDLPAHSTTAGSGTSEIRMYRFDE